MSNRVIATPLPRRRFAVLALTLAAATAAGGAQACVRTRPWLSLGGFALGMLLFMIAERLVPATSEPEVSPCAGTPRGFWWLCGAGAALCGSAGILVYGYAPCALTQPVWGLGMLLWVVAALRAKSKWRSRPPPVVIAALAFLVVLAVSFFAVHLATLPPEVHADEAEVGNDAIRLLRTRPFDLFTTGWAELPILHALPTALGVKMFGINLLGLRSASVVLGTATVLLLFGIAYRFYGLGVALASSLLLVSARFFVHLSRTGYHYIQPPFFSVLAVWLFVQAWYDLSLAAAVSCGIAIGLGIQGYYPSRLIPMLLAGTWLLWLPGSERALRRVRVERFALIVAAALATAAPMIGFFAHQWHQLWGRTRVTSIFGESAMRHLSSSYHVQGLPAILHIQVQKALTLFNLTCDATLQYGYVDGGLFEPVTAALFVLGLATIAARPWRRANLLLLLWIVMPVIFGCILTIDAPSYPRLGGVVPFAALLGGLALQRVAGSIRQALPIPAGRVAAVCVCAALLAAALANNIRTYFIDYAPHHRHSSAVEISAWIRAHGAGKTTYMVGGAPGFFMEHGTIRFLAYGHATADIVDLDGYLQTHRLDPATSVFIIMPPGRERVPKLEAVLGPLDLEEHRTIHDDVGFYGAIPRDPAPTPRNPHADAP